jgi:hypothetical protein
MRTRSNRTKDLSAIALERLLDGADHRVVTTAPSQIQAAETWLRMRYPTSEAQSKGMT